MAHITATIGLQIDDKTRHWLYFQRSPSATSRHKSPMGGSGVQITQPIYDGRGKNLKLDDTSFELIEIPTSLTTDEFYAMKDDSAIQDKYHKEVEPAVKEMLGCDKVIFMHHQVRNASMIGTPGVAGYAGGGPHTDSSGVSGDELAMQMLKAHGDSTIYKRYLYVNLWRSIAEDPIENDHLAVLDERTTAKPDDYIPKDLFGPGYSVVQYGLNARHAKHHKWYYFPKMTKNEGLMFKQVDSDFTLPGRTCFHMSVTDPGAGQDAKPRQSIELRMFCYWKQAAVDSMPTEDNMYLSMRKDPETAAEDESGASNWSSLVGSWAHKLFGPLLSNKQAPATTYTGNPKDYIKKFTDTIAYFPQWPKEGKEWALQLLDSEGAEHGIRKITQSLVDDSLGYAGTKEYSVFEKNVIVEALLANSGYMSECEQRLVRDSKL